MTVKRSSSSSASDSDDKKPAPSPVKKTGKSIKVVTEESSESPIKIKKRSKIEPSRQRKHESSNSDDNQTVGKPKTKHAIKSVDQKTEKKEKK